MKKTSIILALILMPLCINGQNYFDSLEDEDGITSVIVNANMFSLMSKIDISTDDSEAKELLNVIKSITNLKVFVAKDESKAAKMETMMKSYLRKSNLEELMRIKDENLNVKFYIKEGSTPDKVAELLMFVSNINKKIQEKNVNTVLLSLTGDFDLKQVSKLTKTMNIPGGEHLKKAKRK